MTFPSRTTDVPLSKTEDSASAAAEVDSDEN